MKNFTFNDSGGNRIKKTRRWLNMLVLCMMVAFVSAGYGQMGTIQIGSGTQTVSGSTAIPVSNYVYNYSQQIVTASEYGMGGGGEGNITKIRYKVSNVGTINVWNSWTIYLGNTDKTEFISDDDWVSVSDLTQVFSGIIPTPIANNWFEIEFTVPFNYTGENIVVAVHENTLGWLSSPTFSAYTSTDNSGIMFRSDSENPSPSSPPTAYQRVSVLPQLQFEGTLASCPPPTDVVISDITTGSALVSWTSLGTSFDLEYGETGFTPTGTPSFSDISNNFSLGGLNSSTSYDLYIRQNCTANNDGLSVWAGPFSFTTECDVFGVPFQEQFTTGVLPNCWTNTSSNTVANGLWKFTGTVDYAVGNTKTNGTFAWVDGSDPSNINDITLTSPPIDVSSLTVPYVSFEYFSNNTGTYPNNIFTAQVYDGIEWTTIYTDNTSQANWREIEISLTTFTATTLQVRFIVDKTAAPSGNAFYNDILLDNLKVMEAPVCIHPPSSTLTATNITTTSAELSWTSTGTLFDIEYGVTGFTPTGIPTHTGVANNYVLGGLSPITTYQYYVRQDCGLNGESFWSGPFSFTTLCGAITSLPYTENFDTYGTGSNAFPNCWERPVTYMNGGITWPSIVTYQGSNRLRLQSLPTEATYAVSPAFAEDINNLRVKFQLRREGNSSGTLDIGVMSDPFDLSTFELVETLNPANGVDIDYLFNLDTTTLSGPNNYIVFRHNSSANNWYYWLDDFVVEPIPACLEPSDLNITNVNDNSATLGWTSAGVLFDIKWGIAGFDLETEGTLVSGENNPYVLSGLSQSTAYEFYVRQDCGVADGVSIWTGPFSFMTTQTPAILDYEEGFENVHNWTLSNGTQTNKWVVGEATNNGGTHALYISNDNGVSNSYSHTTSTVHAYRDVQIPADADSVLLSFDWKSGGEGTTFFYDYFRVWVVPTSFTPTPGTQITVANSGGVQFGTQYLLQSNWTNQWFEIPSMDYAGQIVRLVFEWRNDGGGGTQPGAAIDNVAISVVSCPAPTGLAATDITTTSAELSWASSGTSFDIEYGVTGFTPTGVPTLSGVANNYVLDGLSASTNYQYYVRQDCGAGDLSAWSGPFSFTTLCDVITTLPYTENFDTYGTGSNAFPNCWERPVTYSNGTTWPSIVAVSANSSPNSLRFQSLTTEATYAVSPAFAEDINNLRVKFSLRREGTSSGTIDFGVMSDPFDLSTFELVQTINPADNVFHEYLFNLNTTTLSGGNNYIAFRHNSNSSAWYYWLDDFVVELIPSCLEPSDLGVTNVNDNSADLTWGGIGSLFDIKWGVAGFDLDTEGTLVSGENSPYTLSGLTQSTSYDFYVRQDCTANEDGLSVWTGPFTFTTTQIPVTLDYEEDFEGAHNWILSNGTQTNKWIVGEATNNGGTHALYISNDNGVSNAYSHTASTVHAYRDIQIPSDADSVLLSFDWKSGGEGTTFFYDYFRVWVVPASFTPTPGTQITSANSGGVQFGEHFLLQANWGNQWFEIPSIDYAGQVVRLVFEWRNDGGGGTQPGAAIDNIEVSVVTCPTPSGLTAGNLTLNSADISWASSGTAFNIEYGVAGFALGSGTTETTTSTSYSLTGLTAHTSYEFYVQQDCGVDGLSAWSGPHFFHTGHCVPTSTNSGDHIVSFVTTGGLPFNISNTNSGTSPGGYGNFGNMSVSHYETGSVDFTVTNSTGMGVNIWIDWNNNLEFEESEKVYASGATGTSFTGTITVPFGVPEGDYRMRVRGQWNNSNPAPCGNISWGEAEDYTFTVITPPTCLPPFTPTAVNISATSVALSWQSNGTLFDIEYGPTGFTPGTGTTIPGVGNPYTLGGLTGGTTYDFYVRQDCGEDDGYSMWNGPVTFTPGVFEGDIPTLLNANPQVEDIACATSFSIDVPEGQQIASLTVEYIMISIDPAWTSQQRSVLYSSTLGMGEPEVVTAGAQGENYPGIVAYNREVTFANGATGTVAFELKAWRTSGGTGCSTQQAYVMDGSWILNATFEPIPTCPNPPTDLGYTNITEDSVDLIWEAEPGTFQIKWGTVGFNTETEGTTISDITTNSYNLSGLDASIAYEFYVRRDCSTDDGEDFGEWAGPFKFNAGYCLPTSTLTYHFSQFNTSEAINNIIYSNSGGGTGYVNNTNMVVTVNAGESFDFTSNYVGGPSGLKIWIDWNKNFIFEEDEEVFELANNQGVKTGTIAIPADAINGEYRMRVRAQQEATSIPPACGVIDRGQALDFTLEVQGGVNNTSDFNSFAFAYYPNPVGEMLYLKANTEIDQVTIYNMLGQQLRLPIHSGNTQIDMTGLPAGNYVMSVTIEGINKTFKVVKK